MNKLTFFFVFMFAAIFYTLPSFAEVNHLSTTSKEGMIRTINYEDGRIEKQIKYTGGRWRTYEVYCQDKDGNWSWKRR